jgi:hypothetical protein
LRAATKLDAHPQLTGLSAIAETTDIRIVSKSLAREKPLLCISTPNFRWLWPAALATWPAALATWPAALATWPAALATWPAALATALVLRRKFPSWSLSGARRAIRLAWVSFLM